MSGIGDGLGGGGPGESRKGSGGGGGGGAGKGNWTGFERDCLASLEGGEGSSGEEEESGGRGSLWDDYESTALSIARLYQGQGWLEFQAAAAASTQLYKDSVEAQRRAKEAGRLKGRQRLMKELVGYLRSAQGRGPFLRRQDLIAFLAGRSPPSHCAPGALRLDALRLASSAPSAAAANSAPPTEGLRMFGQALAPSVAFRAASPRRAQLQRFFVEQVRRHRKRGPEEDSAPDSPNAHAKRQRRL